MYLKRFDDAEWVKCSVAGKQPGHKRKNPTSWRGWYVLDFDDFKSSNAFDLLSLARHGRVRYQKAPSKANPQNSADEDGEEQLEVEAILGKTTKNGKICYKVRWKGYDHTEDT